MYFLHVHCITNYSTQITIMMNKMLATHNEKGILKLFYPKGGHFWTQSVKSPGLKCNSGPLCIKG